MKNGFNARVENEQAWRVSMDQVKAGNFNDANKLGSGVEGHLKKMGVGG